MLCDLILEKEKNCRQRQTLERLNSSTNREQGGQGPLPPTISVSHCILLPHPSQCLISYDTCTQESPDTAPIDMRRRMSIYTKTSITVICLEGWVCKAVHASIHTQVKPELKVTQKAGIHTYTLAVGQREFTMATGEWGSSLQRADETGEWTDITCMWLHTQAATFDAYAHKQMGTVNSNTCLGV